MSEALELRVSRYDHPDALAMTEQAQQYYVEIYGGPDDDPLTVDQFSAPRGGFLIGYLDGEAVAMGGWLFIDPSAGSGHASTGSRHAPEPSAAQIRRMFVSPAVRRLGCGQRLLRALEEDAAAHGATRLLLSTGQPQTEAVALYRAAGYVDVEPFGFYAGSVGAVHLGKDL